MSRSLIKIKLPNNITSQKIDKYFEVTNNDVLFEIQTQEGVFRCTDADSGGYNSIALIFSVLTKSLQIVYDPDNPHPLREISMGTGWTKQQTAQYTTFALEVEGVVNYSDAVFYVEESELQDIFSPDWITIESIGGDKFLNRNGLARYNQKITTKINGKQPMLSSGSNIKTINGQSILGAGNLEVGGRTYTNGTAITINNNDNSISVNDDVKTITGKIEYVWDAYGSGDYTYKIYGVANKVFSSPLQVFFPNSKTYVELKGAGSGSITIYPTKFINNEDWSDLWQ